MTINEISELEQSYTESKIQHICVAWFRLTFPHVGNLLFSVPNGGWRGGRAGATMVYEGQVKGVADLMLCGLYGNGKTTLAKALAWLIGYITEREYGYSRRANVRFYTAKDICRLCAASEKFKEQYDQYDDIFREPMIIIDELGEEPREVMVYGMIHTPLIDLIGERYAQQRMTIITTNLDVDELKAKYGERIYDRFTEMITSVIFENDSYRPNR